MLVTELDLPEFDYFDPTLRGERLHRVLRELREKHWLARGPVGWLVLDRGVTIELLRDPVGICRSPRPTARWSSGRSTGSMRW